MFPSRSKCHEHVGSSNRIVASLMWLLNGSRPEHFSFECVPANAFIRSDGQLSSQQSPRIIDAGSTHIIQTESRAADSWPHDPVIKLMKIDSQICKLVLSVDRILSFFTARICKTWIRTTMAHKHIRAYKEKQEKMHSFLES